MKDFSKWYEPQKLFLKNVDKFNYIKITGAVKVVQPVKGLLCLPGLRTRFFKTPSFRYSSHLLASCFSRFPFVPLLLSDGSEWKSSP